jgi:hypothetical protein
VNPDEHVAATVHVPVTATAFPPHAAMFRLAEFAIVSPSAAVHSQYGAVPLHVPAIVAHVYVAGVPVAVSPLPHVPVTVHVAPPTTATHAPTLYVAPFALVSVSAAHWHTNVAGVSTPSRHASPVPDDTTYGDAHVGTQLAPLSIVAPSPHVAEFATVGRVHAFALHTGAVPVMEPSTLHV